MPALVKNGIVDSILEKTDIVELIAARIPLKKTGANYKAVCPFHNEKTPSFVVSPVKQIFHCFGCGAGGNAITFLLKYDKLIFPEALNLLAEKANVKLPRISSRERRKGDVFEKLYELNGLAKEFYQRHLFSPEGKITLRYLEDRGVSEETMKLFQLGYSPNLWEGVISFFKSRDVSSALLEKAGLALKREKGEGYYDRFRNRVIFPIFNMTQSVLGFGARALDNSIPKYINSPETIVYSKGRNLFGLNLSKKFIREKDYAVIVEGYLDLIIPYQYGVKNIVATLGTALTGEQVKLIRRYSRTVVIVFDSDKAGQEAALRGLDILVSMDMNVRIATLPKGYDPDSFVRQYGVEAFRKVLGASKDLFDYKIGLLMSKFNKDGVRGRAAIATLMLPTISRISNEILKASFLKKLSQMISIDEFALKTELRKVRKDYTYKVSLKQTPAGKANVKRSELLLLSVIMDNPRYMPVLSAKLGIDKIKGSEIKDILKAIKDLHIVDSRKIPSRLIAYFEEESMKRIISKAVGVLEVIGDKEKVLYDCIKRVKDDNFKENLSVLRKEIRFAQDSNDLVRVSGLVSQYNELLKEHKG